MAKPDTLANELVHLADLVLLEGHLEEAVLMVILISLLLKIIILRVGHLDELKEFVLNVWHVIQLAVSELELIFALLSVLGSLFTGLSLNDMGGGNKCSNSSSEYLGLEHLLLCLNVCV